VSSLVFPVPANLKQGGVGWPVKKAPLFRTIVQTPASMRGENRIALMPYPIWMFELSLEFIRGDFSAAQAASFLQSLVGFFMAVQGQFQDWLYSDPYDNSVTNMQFGVGDGATTAFQIVRTIGGASDLIQNLSGTPTIKVNNVTTTPASIGSTGLVTFSSAPASLATITWTGSFYFRCRFLDDTWADLEEFMNLFWSLSTLKFKSVLL
jgi:hypothetical protein